MANDEKKKLEHGDELSLDWRKTVIIKEEVLPVCVQDVETKEVLAIMYMDEIAFKNTCISRRLHLYSTSRKKSWVKGEESGNTFAVVSFRVNCEQNSLLCLVRPEKNGICHVHAINKRPYSTCFYREIVDLDFPYEIGLVEG